MKRKKISDYFWSLATIVVILYVTFKFGYAILNNNLVDEKAIHITAVVIDEENYYPNQHIAPYRFSYSYEFEVGGKKYKGNSHDESLMVGDSVEVKYYEHCPYFNKPVHPKE